MEPALKHVRGNRGSSATASSRRERTRQQELEHCIHVVPVPEAGKGKCGPLHTK
ncbi:hypothetical protein A2U01_0034649 [Trifolium medium]|uniref:Uncharacterized protein n=1 Tax=Trifolium medium TaxID=97028 RepID=A0A392PN64_9FABA|nr:hypothetical protein [Trifolium medium]